MVDPQRLAAYRKVCGFADNGLLPPTYPHILAFALQMQLLTAKDFPFPLLGLIHLSNRIRVLRPMGGVNRVRVSVQVQNLQPHAKGATFDLVTTLDDQLGPLWEAQSQMLCRGVKLEGEPVEEVLASTLELMEVARWQAPTDIGRQIRQGIRRLQPDSPECRERQAVWLSNRHRPWLMEQGPDDRGVE